MKKYCNIILIVCIFLVIGIRTSQADTFDIEIQKFDSEIIIHRVECNDGGELCQFDMLISAEKKKREHISAALIFRGGGVYFRFKKGSDYLSSYHGQGYFYVPIGNLGAEKYRMVLFHPIAQKDSVDYPHLSPVLRRSNNIVADFEVTIKPQ